MARSKKAHAQIECHDLMIQLLPLEMKYDELRRQAGIRVGRSNLNYECLTDSDLQERIDFLQKRINEGFSPDAAQMARDSAFVSEDVRLIVAGG